ncbi:hypothetical protein FISHEDRAFT_63202 [Fistulina hepatica ATCC 64428]|uniref:Ubiquinol-cytochrome c chaperone domain-containing protein n=1 Tax=Fistulina hepatica ATCC 64428 TaxID=1128425 RepID=A0A0D7ARN2_9AGAR|nr:hypothetical protein FISHEDRAFT_63202 [Fistulina hepatica ATCC 64428]
MSLLARSAPEDPPQNWLTRKVLSSPTWRKNFMRLVTLLGYNTPQQVAGRRSFVLYERVCAVRPDDEADFWHYECDLPPTFQSWFTVTNLHIWMLTVRLRALPPPHGRAYIQGLIDHFFLDVEDRIRAVLQPQYVPPRPYTFNSPFYINPNAAPPPDPNKPRPRLNRAPERLVTRQMKIFREQWQGLGISFDIGILEGDMDMAAAVWRNFLGARGAAGIVLPIPGKPSKPFYRRSVNLLYGGVVDPRKVDFEKEAVTDDGSGVHDYPPDEADKYVKYPELMVDIVSYVRREMIRLAAIPDEVILKDNMSSVQNNDTKNSMTQTVYNIIEVQVDI